MTEQKFVECKTCKVETENLEKGLCPVCREPKNLHKSTAQKLRNHLQNTEPQKKAISIIIFIVTKKLFLGLFSAKSCFILTYLHKFKSEQCFNNETKKEVHSGVICNYKLINYITHKVRIFRFFRKLVIHNRLGVRTNQ